MNAVIHELFSPAIYKRSQGRIARQLTFAVLAVALLMGCWQLYEYDTWKAGLSALRLAVPGGLLLLGAWFAYRLVNIPRFADFLIAVEAEMNKVSWPSRKELFRSSLVVLIFIFFLAFILFAYDLFWKALLYDLLNIAGKPPDA